MGELDKGVAFRAAVDAAFPGLPYGMPMDEAERRVAAALSAYRRQRVEELRGTTEAVDWPLKCALAIDRAETAEAKLSDCEKELAILRNVHYRLDDGRGCREAYEALRAGIEDAWRTATDEQRKALRPLHDLIRKAADKEGE